MFVTQTFSLQLDSGLWFDIQLFKNVIFELKNSQYEFQTRSVVSMSVKTGTTLLVMLIEADRSCSV